MVLGAVLALVGVAAAATLYLTRDRYPELEFDSLRELSRPDGRPRTAGRHVDRVLDDRAYLAYPLPDDRLKVVAVDAGNGRSCGGSRPTCGPTQGGDLAVPGAVAVLADAPGDSTPRRWPSSTLYRRATLAARLRGDDAVYFADDTAVLVDRAAAHWSACA